MEKSNAIISISYESNLNIADNYPETHHFKT